MKGKAIEEAEDDEQCSSDHSLATDEDAEFESAESSSPEKLMITCIFPLSISS